MDQGQIQRWVWKGSSSYYRSKSHGISLSLSYKFEKKGEKGRCEKEEE